MYSIENLIENKKELSNNLKNENVVDFLNGTCTSLHGIYFIGTGATRKRRVKHSVMITVKCSYIIVSDLPQYSTVFITFMNQILYKFDLI